eukprot:3508620-Alexandrium_andersonii.AAC.1
MAQEAAGDRGRCSGAPRPPHAAPRQFHWERGVAARGRPSRASAALPPPPIRSVRPGIPEF